MSEIPVKKKVDEAWKEQVEREKVEEPIVPGSPAPVIATPAPASKPAGEPPTRANDEASQLPEAQFDLFVSGLAMDILASLGDIPHPVTRMVSTNLPQAKYLIDLLGVLEEKTRGNLTVDEERMFKDTLYQLRMRYLNKTSGPIPT